ncbi:NADP-dependent oxidoreductase [Demequina sp. TTPB684]|uniref:NADP-dependent oxidoreductase n=1 Tax=unclassified Demequina TaxID=2620311 RepID=UPI001CF58547|nr:MULTISPECIES: NADP-dependent oxidoreductase [unclassified Demequina]MCB2412778.1 NADP-dependent oxidoreductase [Demequina sp. TTPB684]UPU87125.1 NADP-dependent oxidoreductase [Demequina sp. TMPB413]
MRAITYSEFGTPDVLTLTGLPEPRPGPDSVIVEMRAAGINPVDWKARQGYLEGLIDTVFPAVPGWDIAGVVVRVGADAPEFEVGDEVYGYARKDVLGGGTLAEQVAVPVRALAHKPASVSFEQAAAVPLVGLTALRSVRRSHVGAGDNVLIHNGSGGVGGFAIQLARLAGATVVATASPRNHEYLKSLGATPIEYGECLAERARAASPDGFDVILDFAGDGALDSTASVMRDGARVVSVADGKAARRLGGVVVWVRPDAAGLTELARLIDDGSLRVEVARTYPLEAAADAYRELEAGHVRGKLVITP